MKKTKKLFMFMFAVIMVCAISFTTALAAPSTITVKRAEVISDLVTNKDHGFTIFETTDGKTIYCMDNLLKPLKSGQKPSLAGNADAGILYLLQNGYPNKKITGNSEIDFYVTQAAIWWYLDETGQGSNKLSDEFKGATTTDIYDLIPTYIKPMVANAKKAKDTQVKPSMALKTNGEDLTLTSDKKYYESPLMTATLTGASTYKVTVAGGTKGTKVVNEKGEAKSSFNSNEKIKVVVPANEIYKKTTMTVSFMAEGSIKKAEIYKTNDSSYQRVTGLYDELVPLEKSTKLVVTPKAHVCEVDGDKYYGIKGNIVDKETYDAECNKHVCEIVGDKYYGSNGTIVDKATFDAECGNVVVVPNTSSNISAFAIVMGLLMVVSGSGLIAYRSKKSCL